MTNPSVVNVLQLIPTMSDGGAETMVKDYCLLCDKSRINMTIVVWSAPMGSANEHLLQQAGAEVIFLGKASLDNPTNNLCIRCLRRIKKYIDFRKIVKQKNIDVIHVHLRFGHYMRALGGRTLKRLQIYLTIHNEPTVVFDTSKDGVKGFEYKETKRLVEKFGLTLITLHSAMNDEVRKLFDTERVITVNNGINFSRFDYDRYSRQDTRDALGLSERDFVIGHIGSFTKQKNHAKVIEIFAKYSTVNQSAKLLLVGKGILKDSVVYMISELGLSDRVILLENRSDIPMLMKAMDVFLFPSLWEGFGNVLIEAQRMKLRCIISDAIPCDVILSELITVVGLEEPIQQWIDAIDDKLERSKPIGCIEDYDMRQSERILEGIWFAGKQ